MKTHNQDFLEIIKLQIHSSGGKRTIEYACMGNLLIASSFVCNASHLLSFLVIHVENMLIYALLLQKLIYFFLSPVIVHEFTVKITVVQFECVKFYLKLTGLSLYIYFSSLE